MISSANDSPLTPLRFLQRSAEVYPAKDAIVYGARRYTYAEFADVAQRFARALKARIEPGDRVVFLAPNLPEMLIAHFVRHFARRMKRRISPDLKRRPRRTRRRP